MGSRGPLHLDRPARDGYQNPCQKPTPQAHFLPYHQSLLQGALEFLCSLDFVCCLAAKKVNIFGLCGARCV